MNMRKKPSDSKVTDQSDQLTKHKEIIRKFFEVTWNEGNFTGLENCWAPECVTHFRGEQNSFDLNRLQALVENWRKAFPDLHCVVEDLLGDDDRVAVRLSFSGTHTGAEWFGLQPSGKTWSVTEQVFFRFEKGKIVEAWEDYDEYAMRQQLGALPPDDASQVPTP